MSTYCFAELGEHEQNVCGTINGGSNAVAVLDADHAITDFADDTQWLAAIAAGKARIIKGVKANFPNPSPVTQPNPEGCGPATITTGFDFTLPWLDANVSVNNDEFYAALNKKGSELVFFECSTGDIRVVDQSVRYQAFPATLPEANTEYQVYNVTANWSTRDDWYPVRYTAPTGIFA